jgi:VWFA-related protein
MIAGRVASAFLAVTLVQAPAFRVETRLVVLHATVNNPNGDLVTTLDRSAFRVYENGKPQPITLFRRDDVPVSVGLLIDNSGSMRTLRGNVEAAALAFARASNPLDDMFVVNFADTPRVDVAMTSDARVLEAGIARVDSIGGTAMWDAVDAAEHYLDVHGDRDRRALLLITDGHDNASGSTLEAVESAAAQRDVVVFGVWLAREKDTEAKHGRRDLERLANRTGGAVYAPADADDIDRVTVDIAHQIRTQYTLAYAPTNQRLDGTYRTIRVTAAGSQRLTVHTRAGYRAVPGTHLP